MKTVVNVVMRSALKVKGFSPSLKVNGFSPSIGEVRRLATCNCHKYCGE